MVRVSMAQRARQDRDDVRVGVFVGWGGGAYFFLQDCTAFRTPKNHPPPSPFISRYLYYLIFFFFTGRSYRALRYRASVLKMAMNIWQLRGD